MNKPNALRFRATCVNYLRTVKRMDDAYINSLDMGKYCPINEHSANNLTKRILEFLKWSGWQAERISSTGQARIKAAEKVKGGIAGIGRQPRKEIIFVKGSGTKGTADISATIKGLSVKIEVKFGKDRQSDVQRKYQKDVEAAGGIYLIANCFDNFLYDYDVIINEGKVTPF